MDDHKTLIKELRERELLKEVREKEIEVFSAGIRLQTVYSKLAEHNLKHEEIERIEDIKGHVKNMWILLRPFENGDYRKPRQTYNLT
jgi:hypothetical protein